MMQPRASLDPIAYTYNADRHCPECAWRKYGSVLDEAIDDEGNPVGAIAPWDEWHIHSEHLQDFPDTPAVLMCSTCEEIIETCERCGEVIEERAQQDRLTLDQIRRAQSLTHGMHFYMHAPGCTRVVTSRGVEVTIARWRPHGVLKTHAVQSDWYSLPIRHGLMVFDILTHENSHGWHMERDCPLGDDPQTQTIGDTQLQFELGG